MNLGKLGVWHPTDFPVPIKLLLKKLPTFTILDP